MRTIKNQFAKACLTCKTKVEIKAGFAVQDENVWKTYCSGCVPVRIEEPQTRAEVTVTGDIFFPYSSNAVAAVKSLPSAKYNKDGKYWSVTPSASNLTRILEIARQLNLTVAPELIAAESEINLHSVVQLQQVLGNKSLFPFQREGVKFLTTQDRCILGDEMGTGKTIQTLCALPTNIGVLVVCPAALKYNWSDEAAKWRSDLKVTILNGRGNFRFPEAGEIVITNYDILPQEFLISSQYYLICDEIHLCKNHKTKRSKAVKTLASSAQKVIGLTGTPLTNRPFDLYGVLSALHLDRQVFGSWINFLKCFNGYKNNWGGYEFGSPLPIVPELLRRVMLRRRREEVLPELPKKSYSTITVNGISAKLVRLMDDLYEDYGTMIDAGELPPFEEFAKIRAELAESRIPAILELVDSHEEEGIPLVVFSAHRSPILELGNREGWEIITGSTDSEKRQEIVRKFQSGQLKGIGLTIQAGGVGLTLTHAWKAIFVDLDWTPAWNSQAEDRICRIGQTKPVEIVRMVANHPLDLHIHALLAEKIALIQSAIDDKIVLNPINKSNAINETEEDFIDRMNSIVVNEKTKEEARSKEIGLKKVEIIISREIERLGQFTPPELTPKLKKDIEKALEFMLGECDGAVSRDTVGFNKPDAFLSRFIYMAGLDEEKSLIAAYLMLKRYSRQLKGEFSGLWNN